MTTISNFLNDVEKNEIKAYADHPLIKMLKDDSIPAEVKLRAMVKQAGVFAFNFRMLNKDVLKYPDDEAKGHPIKTAINRHCREDGNHWPFWCYDNEALGLNVDVKVNDMYKWIFGNETQVSRADVINVSKWIGKHGDSPYARYTLISLIELHGDLLFGITLPVAHEWQAETGKRLDYFGDKHRARETGTLQNQGDKVLDEMAHHILSEEDLVACNEARKIICGSISTRWEAFSKAMKKEFERVNDIRAAL